MPKTWLETVYTVWSVVCLFSVFLYILLLITLVKHRKTDPLNSTFFRICRWLTVYDLVMLLCMYVKRLLNNDTFALLLSRSLRLWGKRLIVSAIFYAGVAEHFGVVLMAVNRFIGIVLPLRHEQIWNRIITPSLTLNLLCPLIVAAGAGLNQDTYFTHEWNGETNTTVEKLVTKVPLDWLSVVVLWMLTANIICSVLYAVTVVKLISGRNEIATPTLKTEIKLTVCGMSLFLVLFVYSCALVRTGYTQKSSGTDSDEYKAAVVLMNLTGELYACINPYLLLVCCSTTRAAFVDVVKSVINAARCAHRSTVVIVMHVKALQS